MTRAELTEKIVTHKIMKGIKWADVAEKVGLSKEWVTAALLGQMSMTKEQATTAANAMGLNLSEEEIAMLMTVPSRGSLDNPVPTDPLIYRLYELVQVYGTTFKALIEEEFGDGHRFQHGHRPAGRPQGRPCGHHPERQVPALQGLLRTIAGAPSMAVGRHRTH